MAANVGVFMKKGNLKIVRRVRQLGSKVLQLLSYFLPPFFHKYHVGCCRLCCPCQSNVQIKQSSVSDTKDCPPKQSYGCKNFKSWSFEIFTDDFVIERLRDCLSYLALMIPVAIFLGFLSFKAMFIVVAMNAVSMILLCIWVFWARFSE